MVLPVCSGVSDSPTKSDFDSLENQSRSDARKQQSRTIVQTTGLSASGLSQHGHFPSAAGRVAPRTWLADRSHVRWRALGIVSLTTPGAQISLAPSTVPNQLGSCLESGQVNPPISPGRHSNDVHVGFQSCTLVAEMGEPRTVLGRRGPFERSLFPKERPQETRSKCPEARWLAG